MGLRLFGQSQSTVLKSSTVGVSHTGDTVEFTYATVTIPILGAKDILEIQTLWTTPTSANSKTTRIKLGGTSFASPAYTTVTGIIQRVVIQNRGATNSQIGSSYGNRSTDTVFVYLGSQTGAIDTSVATSLTITGQLASAAETMTLECYFVTLTRVP